LTGILSFFFLLKTVNSFALLPLEPEILRRGGKSEHSKPERLRSLSQKVIQNIYRQITNQNRIALNFLTQNGLFSKQKCNNFVIESLYFSGLTNFRGHSDKYRSNVKNGTFEGNFEQRCVILFLQ